MANINKGLVAGLVILGLVALAGFIFIPMLAAQTKKTTQPQLSIIPSLVVKTSDPYTGVIKIEWSITPDVIGTDVYRSANGGITKENSVLLTSLGIGINTYTDTAANGVWYYAIIIKYLNGESKFSNVVSFTVTIPEPGDLLVFWKQSFPNDSPVLSTVTFSRASFSPLPTQAASSTGMVIYQMNGATLNAVLPGASTYFKTYTVSANGLCCVNYRGNDMWYLFVKT